MDSNKAADKETSMPPPLQGEGAETAQDEPKTTARDDQQDEEAANSQVVDAAGDKGISESLPAKKKKKRKSEKKPAKDLTAPLVQDTSTTSTVTSEEEEEEEEKPKKNRSSKSKTPKPKKAPNDVSEKDPTENSTSMSSLVYRRIVIVLGLFQVTIFVIAVVLLATLPEDSPSNPSAEPLEGRTLAPTPLAPTRAPTFAPSRGSTLAVKLTASDGAAADFFGFSVAVDGDTIVVGAFQDDDSGNESGSAYVFTRSGTVWAEQQTKLTASDGAELDNFGESVDVDGDTIVVGARRHDGNAFNSGSAYVFTRTGTVWAEQTKLTASDGAAFDNFGRSVAIDGDTIIIGAEGDGDNGFNSGSAYVFTRSGTVWTQQTKLTANDGPAAGDSFGESVAIDGDTIVIGARWDDDNGRNTGSAYVFTRTGTVWTQQTKLTAIDGAADDSFGVSVAVDGDTIVIGAWAADDDDGRNTGSAYVFTRTGSVWTQQTKLIASDGAAFDLFGASVAVDGDTIVVGARFENETGMDSGSAYVFTRSGIVWKLAASDRAASGQFGVSVAADGDTIVVGAFLDDANGSNRGSAYVFAI